MFRDQILAQLRAKFPGASAKFLGRIADKIAKKVTEESQIEGAITELENADVPLSELIQEFQAEGDRRVTEAQREWKKKNPGQQQQQESNNPEKKEPPTGDEPPAWAKSLIEEVKTLRAEKTQTSMKAKAAEKLKDVPADYYSEWALPEKEEDLDGFVEKVQTKYTAFKQSLANEGFSQTSKPASGAAGGTGGAASDKVDPDVLVFAKKQNEKATSKN